MKNCIKQLLFLCMGVALLTACNDAGKSSEKTGKDTTSVTMSDQKMDYPYTIAHPDYWQTGSQQNTMNVLKSLKAWENKNMDESISYFADSVEVQFDGIDKKVSRDTLKAWISPSPNIISHSVKMQDWESVISNDKKVEYVTIWYREYAETAKGKDSVDVVNDLRMKDGKIIGIDQYTRKLH
ncbi:MAG: hypothetical protein BGO53_05910 [Sphingobacteriales bacterium 39-19]|nr:hypothetical protein [Sphingobacteriales bacterium]OJW10068.1 MAG: hypothetical protein BGO53_05910 [Sphingobacteriales bacterium 39-19]